MAALQDLPFPAAIRFANACGALAVTRAGAQPSLPRLSEVEALLKRQKETAGWPNERGSG